MKSFFGRSAIIASSLLAGLIVFSATPSIADSPLSKSQAQKETKQNPAEALGKFDPTTTDGTAGKTAEEPGLAAASLILRKSAPTLLRPFRKRRPAGHCAATPSQRARSGQPGWPRCRHGRQAAK